MRTIIADDHAIMREGLKQLLSTVDELTVSGEAADAEAVHRLLNESPADLLILDLGMPGVSGFQFIAQLRTAWPELRILVLTANVEPRSVRAAFSAGANGYLTKSGDPSELIAAIDAIRTGNAYVAEEVRFAVNHHDGPNETPEPTAAIISPVTLTRRERQILGMIPHGVTNRDIASRLGISPLTARKHRENLMRKLDLHSGAELTAYAGMPVSAFLSGWRNGKLTNEVSPRPAGARRVFGCKEDKITQGARRAFVSQFLWGGGRQRPHLPGGSVCPEEHRIDELVDRMARRGVSAHLPYAS